MKNKVIIGIITLIIIVIISIVMYYNSDQDIEKNVYINNYLNNNGYTYIEKEKIFKNIKTNNKLKDFYNDLKDNIDSTYDEYTFSIDNNNLVELYMNNKNSVVETFNVEGEVNSKSIKINYEITKDDSSAILEGTYKDEKFDCDIITLKKLSDEGKDTYCNSMKNKINDYIEERNNLLSDKTFTEYISEKKKEVVIK